MWAHDMSGGTPWGSAAPVFPPGGLTFYPVLQLGILQALLALRLNHPHEVAHLPLQLVRPAALGTDREGTHQLRP